MMIFAFFLLGGLAGIFAWFYIDRFIPNLQQEIYQNYVELYPENRPIFHSEKAAIQSQKCGHIFRYFLGFALGIGSYLSIAHLPLFLFIACLLGIIVYWISRKPVLPFAPFLCLSLIITSAINL